MKLSQSGQREKGQNAHLELTTGHDKITHQKEKKRKNQEWFGRLLSEIVENFPQ